MDSMDSNIRDAANKLSIDSNDSLALIMCHDRDMAAECALHRCEYYAYKGEIWGSMVAIESLLAVLQTDAYGNKIREHLEISQMPAYYNNIWGGRNTHKIAAKN